MADINVRGGIIKPKARGSPFKSYLGRCFRDFHLHHSAGGVSFHEDLPEDVSDGKACALGSLPFCRYHINVV